MKKILVMARYRFKQLFRWLVVAPRRALWRCLGYPAGPTPTIAQKGLEDQIKRNTEDIDSLVCALGSALAYINKLKAVFGELSNEQ